MSLIHRLLQRLMGVAASFVCARPGLILGVGLFLAVASAGIVAFRFKVIDNTSQLLSDKLESKKQFNELIKDFGSDYRFIILIKSDDPVKNRQVADEVGPWLEAQKPQLTMVLDKIDFSNVKQRLLFTREPDELRKIAKQLEDQSSAQAASASATAFDLNSILNEANQKFDDAYLRDKKNWVDFKPFVKQFVSVLNKVADQAEGKKSAPKPTQDEEAMDDFDANEMLAEHEYFSLQDGKAILLFAYTGADERDGPSAITATIRQHFKELEAKYPGVTIGLTGEPALDSDTTAMSTADSAKAGAITLALIIILFFFSYHAFLRPTFTFLVLIIGVLWALAFAFLTVGHLNVLSVAVIPMVLGIGIDFGIQILGRYEEELGLGRTVHEAVTAAMQHTGVAIITGGSTTAIAFFTLCFNEFSGLAELGVIAGSGMVLCIVANLLLLPAIFILSDRSRSAASLQAQSSNSSWRFIHSWDTKMVRTPRLWIGVAVLISIASLVSLPYLHFDYNLLHLQNQSADSVKVLYQVMDASKGKDGNEISTIYASIVTDNIEQARDISKRLMELPEVAKVESILELVPENQDEKKPIIERIVKAAASLNVKPAASSPEVDIPKARADIKRLLQSAREGYKQASGMAGVSKMAKDAVAAFGTMIPALDRAEKALNSGSVEEIKARFSASSGGAFSRMQQNLELLKSQKADRGLTLADIPPQLQKLFVASNGKILLQVYGKQDLWERGPDEKFTQAIMTVAPKATGSPVLNYYATELLRTSYLWAAAWSFVAIVVLIFLHFQSFKYLALTITPLVLAVLWRTGAMVWFGLEFNPANIVTMPLIIGIDVAFGVYIVDRYREDGKLSIFAGSTGKAIIMSSLTSLFGFLSLLVSTFTGMYSIGVLMSLGIAIGLVTAIFFLPQILVLLKPREPESNEEMKVK